MGWVIFLSVIACIVLIMWIEDHE